MTAPSTAMPRDVTVACPDVDADGITVRNGWQRCRSRVAVVAIVVVIVVALAALGSLSTIVVVDAGDGPDTAMGSTWS